MKKRVYANEHMTFAVNIGTPWALQGCDRVSRKHALWQIRGVDGGRILMILWFLQLLGVKLGGGWGADDNLLLSTRSDHSHAPPPPPTPPDSSTRASCLRRLPSYLQCSIFIPLPQLLNHIPGPYLSSYLNKSILLLIGFLETKGL